MKLGYFTPSQALQELERILADGRVVEVQMRGSEAHLCSSAPNAELAKLISGHSSYEFCSEATISENGENKLVLTIIPVN
ncbi:MAG: hypothetical protein NT111_02410 [Patescibacteria group bacterium]|nr:hypothetical protein [Patescibacteria group bacterium]